MANNPRDYSDTLRFLKATGIVPVELVDLDQFRKVKGIQPNKMPPDYSFEWQGRRISIEHTSLILPSTQVLKQGEAIAKEIYNECLKCLQSLGPPFGFGSIQFNLNLMVQYTKNSHGKRKELVDQIMMDITERIRNPQEFPDSHSIYPKYPLRKPYSLKFRNLEGLSNHELINISLRFSGEYSTEDVLDKVKKKCRNVARYGSEYDENWLLLVVGIDHANTFFDYEAPPDLECFGSKVFDRIYCYDAFAQEAYCWK